MGKDKNRYKKEQNKKERREADKQTRRGNVNHNASAVPATGEGCICPIGCVVGKKILVNEVVGVRAADAAAKNFVKVFCSNANCNQVPFIHEPCFKKWEETLIKQLRMRRVTVDWNDEKVKRHLWLTDGGSYCFRARKCSCGGALGRVDPNDEELPKPSEKAEKNAATGGPRGLTKKKQLPSLLVKRCPGISASSRAAVYSSHDYADHDNRTRNRPENEEVSEHPSEPACYVPNPSKYTRSSLFKRTSKTEDSDDDGDYKPPYGWRKPFSRTTSFSSSVEESDHFWGGRRRVVPPASSYTPHSPLDRYAAVSDWASQQSYPASNYLANIDYEEEKSDDEDEDANEGALIEEIRELLEALGGQLPLDDPLLTDIVGNADGELVLAICEAGGLEFWLGSYPEFDVNNGRVRLCQNIKRSPARLQTSGIVLSNSDTGGIINCPSYDCTIFFDNAVPGAKDLKNGDIVKFEAIECKAAVEGRQWRAQTVMLLQRETRMPPLLTACRQSFDYVAQTQDHKANESKPTRAAKLHHPVFDPTFEDEADIQNERPLDENVVTPRDDFRHSRMKPPADQAKTTAETKAGKSDSSGVKDTNYSDSATTSGPEDVPKKKPANDYAELLEQFMKSLTPNGYASEESAYSGALAMIQMWNNPSDGSSSA